MHSSATRRVCVALALMTTLTAPASAQTSTDTETITAHPYGQPQPLELTQTGKTMACPFNVPVGDRAVLFNGTSTTTSEQGFTREILIRYGSGTAPGKVQEDGQLEHRNLETNTSSWQVSSGETETILQVVTTVSAASPHEWSAELYAVSPGTVWYIWQTKSRGNVQTEETCEFEIIEPKGSIHGQVYSTIDSMGVDGMHVSLLGEGGETVATQVTHGMGGPSGGPTTGTDFVQGLFWFQNLDAGTYTLVLEEHPPWTTVEPASYEQTVELEGGAQIFTEWSVYPGKAPGEIAQLDFGDLPSPYPQDTTKCMSRFGVGSCYPTLVRDNGARHAIRPGLMIGDRIDGESDGFPSGDARGDDQDGSDDEEGWLYGYWVAGDSVAQLIFGVTNDTPTPAFFHVWVDYNDNGKLGDTPIEYALFTVVPPLAGYVTIEASFPTDSLPNFPPYMRMRLTTDPSVGSPYGLYLDGEVEDELFDYEYIDADYGDAPDEPDPTRPEYPAGYPTRLQDDGARHPVTNTFLLGRFADLDSDGQPTIEADGDDNDIGLANDDDGIVFGPGFSLVESKANRGRGGGFNRVYGAMPGTSATITALASTDGNLDAWFDWNRDGDWDDPGEQVFDTVPVQDAPEYTPLTFDIPSDADLGYTYARFRFSLTGGTEPRGLAKDGEVEDYLLKLMRGTEVTSSNDNGPGTFRQALLDANNGLVQFILLRLLGKTAATINLESPLPVITEPVVIDGGGTIIDGSGAGADANGLVIASEGVIVTGLQLEGFQRNGIVLDGAGGNFIDGNRIVDNGLSGIRVVSGSGNTLSRNVIFGNQRLAIDVGEEGVTVNDTDEIDGIQNYPELSSVTAGSTTIEGTLTSRPDTVFHVEFFSADYCRVNGHSFAQRFLGSTSVTTDNTGEGSFSVTFDETVPNNQSVAATATGPDGTTSELSPCAVSVDVEYPEDQALPKSFKLYSNYPNPFNPSTTIRFDVAEPGAVSIHVFDALGRVVATPVAGTMAAGTYNVPFDAGNLPSGVYYYRMVAGSYTATGKMTLLK